VIRIEQNTETVEAVKVILASMNDIAAVIRFDPWCRPQYEVIAISKGFGLVFDEVELGRIPKVFLKSLIQVATQTDNTARICATGDTSFHVSIARKFESGETHLLLVRLSRVHSQTNEDRLTQRERETMEGMERGLSNDEIAAQLNIGVNTVRSYVRRVYVKLKASNRAEAIHAYRGIRELK